MTMPGPSTQILPGYKNSGRNKVEFVGFFSYHHSVTSVGPTLVAHYDIGIVGQKVCDFCLTFISELRSDDNYVSQGLLSRKPSEMVSKELLCAPFS
jgi:hypothetical protein